MIGKPISIRSENYVIPKYTPTEIQAFERCPLQYRFYNKGNLPQSHPVQLWFGEFIHNVMEKSYLVWRDDPDNNKFPWSFENVQKISIEVSEELMSGNLKPNLNNFCECYGENIEKDCLDKHYHKSANETAFSAVNICGKYLFPLMSNNEFKLQGTRKMLKCDANRSGYYSIVGIMDAIDSINIQNNTGDNKLIQYLREASLIDDAAENNSEFDIIIEYKGTNRPEENNSKNSLWKQYERQVMTYMWLHNQKFKKSGKKVICGIILYLSELYPTSEIVSELLIVDKDVLRDRFHATENDIENLNKEKRDLSENSNLSEDFLLRRAICIIPYDEEAVECSLKDFDSTVMAIETCTYNEKRKPESVLSCWDNKDCDEGTRKTCDLKGICGSGKRN